MEIVSAHELWEPAYLLGEPLPGATLTQLAPKNDGGTAALD